MKKHTNKLHQRLWFTFGWLTLLATCVLGDDEFSTSLRTNDNSTTREDDGTIFYVCLVALAAPFLFLAELFGMSGCLDTEAKLREFVLTEGGANSICSSTTITLDEPIDLTGSPGFLLECASGFGSPAGGDCTIEINSSTSGGNMFVGAPDGVAEFAGIRFDSSATGATNGGVFALTGGTTVLTLSRFQGGTATNHGGIIYLTGTGTRVTMQAYTRLQGGTAGVAGGAIAVLNGAVLEGDLSVESSTAPMGGGIYVENAKVNINTVDFYDNTATDRGGNVASLNSKVLIDGGRYKETSTATNGGANIAVLDDSDPAISFVRCGEFSIFCNRRAVLDDGTNDNTDCDIMGDVSMTDMPINNFC